MTYLKIWRHVWMLIHSPWPYASLVKQKFKMSRYFFWKILTCYIFSVTLRSSKLQKKLFKWSNYLHWFIERLRANLELLVFFSFCANSAQSLFFPGYHICFEKLRSSVLWSYKTKISFDFRVFWRILSWNLNLKSWTHLCLKK